MKKFFMGALIFMLSLFMINSVFAINPVDNDYYRENSKNQSLYDSINNSVTHSGKLFVFNDISVDDIAVELCNVMSDHPEYIALSKEFKVYRYLFFSIATFNYNEVDEEKAFAEAERRVSYVNNIPLAEALKSLYVDLINAEYSEEDFIDSTMYGPLVEDKGNCEGYSEAFAYILDLMGVENYLVQGNVNGIPHQWNRAMIDDIWYEFDPTFDATNNKEELVYFMVSKAH